LNNISYTNQKARLFIQGGFFHLKIKKPSISAATYQHLPYQQLHISTFHISSYISSPHISRHNLIKLSDPFCPVAPVVPVAPVSPV